MQIPEDFKAKIRRIFGAEGEDWLRRLGERLERCVRQWRLTNLRLAADLSYNLVCFADSPQYGPVALKLGVPNPELFTEIEALDRYGGRHACALYEADRELGALLLERVLPGEDLDAVSGSERIRIAAGLIARLPVPVRGQHRLPSYRAWLERGFSRARAGGPGGAQLLALIETAEGLFREIAALGRPPLLLHGDCHHKNILRDRDGRWKAIDPKGVIGPHPLEAARFIQNELDRVERAAWTDCLDEMTAVFSAALGETRRTIAACAFVDQVLSTWWGVEEAAGPAWVARAFDRCEALMACLRRLQ